MVSVRVREQQRVGGLVQEQLAVGKSVCVAFARMQPGVNDEACSTEIEVGGVCADFFGSAEEDEVAFQEILVLNFKKTVF